MTIEPGSTIAVIGLSNALDSRRARTVGAGISALKRAGFRVRVSPTVFGRRDHRCGSIAARLSALHQAFADPRVTLILNSTGGFNSNELLEQIDYRLIARNRKWFVGYSDITAINLALYARTGLATVNGPMLVDYKADPSAFTRLFEFLQSKRETYEYQRLLRATGDHRAWPARKPEGIRLTGKPITGRCIAGNLSTLCLLNGTPYMPKLKGAVLFLEYDKEEAHGLPSLERMLWQLRHTGVFDGLRALVFGHLERAVLAEENRKCSLKRILAEATNGCRFPVLLNASFGHLYPAWPLINGAPVVISGDQISTRVRKP